MKISIMGYSGSGKSTLARQLGEAFHIPVFHLDQVHFLEDWKQKPFQEAVKEVEEILGLEHWIMDGNYGNYLLQERLRDSDLILYLKMNRFLCFQRCFKRYRENKGQSRPDVTPGCKEKFDLSFMKWILHHGRNRQKRKARQKNLAPYEDKTVYLGTPKEVHSFLKETLERYGK